MSMVFPKPWLQTPFRLSSTDRKYNNIGSYNYLGLAEIGIVVSRSLRRLEIRDIGVSLLPRAELGNVTLSGY